MALLQYYTDWMVLVVMQHRPDQLVKLRPKLDEALKLTLAREHTTPSGKRNAAGRTEKRVSWLPVGGQSCR